MSTPTPKEVTLLDGRKATFAHGHINTRERGAEFKSTTEAVWDTLLSLQQQNAELKTEILATWMPISTQHPFEDELVETGELINGRVESQGVGYVSDGDDNEAWRPDMGGWGDDSEENWRCTHWRPIAIPPWREIMEEAPQIISSKDVFDMTDVERLELEARQMRCKFDYAMYLLGQKTALKAQGETT